MKDELALLIDGDQGGAQHVSEHLTALEKDWNVSARICIRNWRSATDSAAWREIARAHNLECIQHDPESTGRNASDIELTVRAMDLHHGLGYQAFCILSKDSDFMPLKRRLERAGAKVILCPLSPAGVPETPPKARPRPDEKLVSSKAAPKTQLEEKVQPEAKKTDAAAFAAVVDKAYDKCVKLGLEKRGVIPLSNLAENIPKDQREWTFGFPKRQLPKVIASLAGFEVTGDTPGTHAVRRRSVGKSP